MVILLNYNVKIMVFNIVIMMKLLEIFVRDCTFAKGIKSSMMINHMLVAKSNACILFKFSLESH